MSSFPDKKQILDEVRQVLQEGKSAPRVHPNGFIQLDLGSRKRRFHVWPAEPLVKRSVDTPVHDHTFRFQSLVLLGRLGHFVYEPVPDPTGIYHLYSSGCSAAGRPHDPLTRMTDFRYRLELVEDRWIDAGKTYVFDAFRLHESIAEGLTATFILIDDFDETASPRVVCEYDQVPDSTFRRDAFDQAMLRSIIDDVLDRLS